MYVYWLICICTLIYVSYVCGKTVCVFFLMDNVHVCVGT